MDHNTLFEKTSPSRLFIIVAIPGILGMLASSLYQLIDGVLVIRMLDSDAFAALNLAMPIVILNFAIADLIGVGSAVPIAIKLGEKDNETANAIFTTACLLIVGSGAALGGILYLFAEDFIRILGADESLITMGAQYLRVYAIWSPFTTIIFAVDNYLRICGKVKFSLMINILISIISAVLEYVFLLMGSGISGAALSTVIGMTICTVISFLPFFLGKMQLRFTKPKLDRKILGSIFTNGTPSFLNNVAGRIISIIMNILLLRIGGAIAVSTYGILMFADGFVQPILYGLCDSLQPAIGYNYGAKNRTRVSELRRICFGVSAMVSTAIAIVLFVAVKPVVGIFAQAGDTALFAMSEHALRLFAFTFLTRWISLVAQSYLSAIGKAGYATIISLSMAFAFPLIFLLVLIFWGLDGLWLNMPFSAFLAAILSLILLRRHQKKDAKADSDCLVAQKN